MSTLDNYRVTRTFHVTIPEDASITGGVMDDVDDDGRPYNRSVEGPTVVYLDEVEATEDSGRDRWWEIRGEALALTDGNIEDLLVDVDGEGIVAVEVAAGEDRP